MWAPPPGEPRPTQPLTSHSPGSAGTAPALGAGPARPPRRTRRPHPHPNPVTSPRGAPSTRAAVPEINSPRLPAIAHGTGMGRAPRRADWLWSAEQRRLLLRLGPSFTRIRSTVGAAEVTVVGAARLSTTPTVAHPYPVFPGRRVARNGALRHTRHHIAV